MIVREKKCGKRRNEKIKIKKIVGYKADP